MAQIPGMQPGFRRYHDIEAAVAIHYMRYNFASSHVWSVEEIVGLLEIHEVRRAA